MNNNLYSRKDTFDPTFDLQGAAPSANPRMEEDTAKTLLQNGRLYANSGRYDEAMASYQLAFDMNPQLPGIQFHMGVARFRMGQLAEAMVHFESELQHRPWNALDIYNYLSFIYFKQGDFPKAKATVGKIISVNPGMVNDLKLSATQFFQLMES